MAEKTECTICDRMFKNEEGLAMHNAAKHPESVHKEKTPLITRKVRNWGIFVLIFGALIFGVYFIVASAGNSFSLPPTTMQGHTERIPSSHVLKEPMAIDIQKHMLEHIDGKNGVGGGIIINYDCKNYDCEAGLVEKLEAFAGKYSNVYVAPFKNMAVKIALTKLGRIETFEEFDAVKIETFITGTIPRG